MKKTRSSPVKVGNLHKAGTLALTALLLLVTGVTIVYAQSSGYDLPWCAVSGGGGAVGDASSGYTLIGTAGQPGVGPALSGDGYTLVGGFWSGDTAVEFAIYLPLVLRSYH
jgi:hypothetical protein